MMNPENITETINQEEERTITKVTEKIEIAEIEGTTEEVTMISIMIEIPEEIKTREEETVEKEDKHAEIDLIDKKDKKVTNQATMKEDLEEDTEKMVIDKKGGRKEEESQEDLKLIEH